MASKSFRPSHLELRGKTYFAVLYVPKDVQHVIGRTKFSLTTETGDLSLAIRRASAFVMGWKAEISVARHEAPDPLIAEALDLYAQSKRRDGLRGAVQEVIEERVLELSVSDRYGARAFESLATGQSTPLSALIPAWISSEKARGLAQKTLDQMKADVTPMAEAFRTANLIDQRTATLWIKDSASSRALSASSVTRIVGFCKNFMRYLESTGEATPDSQKAFLIPTEYRKSKRKNAKESNRVNSWIPFGSEEVVELHSNALKLQDQALADLIFIGAYSGGRIEEVCSLKCVNIKLRKGYLDIIDSKTSAGVRQVPIHSKIYERIETLINESEDGYLFSGLTFNKYDDRSNAIGKRFGRLKTKMGFDKQHVFHSIRKTFITQLDNAGVNENIAADIAGHDIPTITYGLYSGGASLETKRQAIELVSYEFGTLSVTPTIGI